MTKHLLKTFVAVLAIAAAAAGPVRGQNSYNVTFGGFAQPEMNTTVSVTSLPQTFTRIGVHVFYPFEVISNCGEFTSASVTSGGNGKVSVDMPSYTQMAIIVSGTFEGTATIHVVGSDYQEHSVSCDITVACAAPPVPITVRMAEGTEEAANWTLASGDASVTGTQVLENVMSGSEVTATYSGTRKVKSVKAVKYVPPAATVTTAPTATTALIEAGSTTALVNAGAANGGTMMYAVTTTNAQPASTADFSATRPTAQGRTAGTYYVWFYAKADAEHSDSEIAGPVSVTVTSAPTTVTWNSSNIGGSYPNGLNVSGTSTSYTKEGITLSANADMNGAQWQDYGDENYGIRFQVNESGGFTFSNTLGKSFTKIEMTLTGQGGWDMASLGTGWAFGENFDPMTMDDPIYKVTWTGSAASTVGLLTGAGMFMGESVKSIVFTLIDD